MRLTFWKVQSIGNDFVLVHLPDVETAARERVPRGAIPDIEAFLPMLAKALCQRRFCIGSDGLLVIGRDHDRLTLRMFNPDGTEDFCGNGLRCAAVHAHRQGWTGEALEIEHGGLTVPAQLLGGGLVRTVIGPADYTPSKVPIRARGEVFNEAVWSGMIDGMALNFFGSALTTGSTHVVIPTIELPDDHSFEAISRRIETDARFPRQTSVIWCQETAPMRLKVRIWERGAGETLGCGTGSAAAAADYMRRRSAAGLIEVENPGGTVRVSAPSWNGRLTVEGVAEELYEGVVDLPSPGESLAQPEALVSR
ncbi:MAG: diaminopimelate epimerase [Fimbriimonas ginsengisoli]|uniref:Diaminopimelate epimerase n=1 Tax=Fimbriimonas ginsengisoli TaxID=1005039 RepID=A0A931PWQ1_FIMGI|nr:diaminopimelate epimerase [Fimbriimonas ginsengisoli]MBI3721075.1 diaminopimelate epimerase [Fimbriimonas ginsengisoli]